MAATLDSAPSDFGRALGQVVQDPLATPPRLLEARTPLPGDPDGVVCPRPSTEERDLSLAGAVDIALCNNPQIQSARAAMEIEAAALGEARAAYWPTVTITASGIDDQTGYSSQRMRTQVVRGNSDSAELDWRVFDFGGRGANRRAAMHMLDAAIDTHDAVVQKALDAVIGAYFDAQTTLATWTAKQSSEEVARRTLESARRRENRGAGAETETLQAATALAKATLDASRSEGGYLKAMAVLTYVLGIAPSARFVLAPDPSEDIDGIDRDLAEWLDEAQRRHPAILAAQAQLEAARENVTATRSDGLPTIDLTFNDYQNGNRYEGYPTVNANERVIGLTLTVPLFEGFSRLYKIRRAKAQVDQKAADLTDTAHEVLMGVVKAHADAVSALRNLGASGELAQTAQRAMSSVQSKFDKGAADILDILSAQAALSDATLERIRCLAEWRAARLRLFAAAGALGRAEIH